MVFDVGVDGVDIGAATDAGTDADADTGLSVKHSFLWRVERDGRRSWLFGTIHGGVKADWEHLPPDVRRAVDIARTIVFETDIRESDASAVATHLTLPRKSSLRRALGPQRFAKLVEYTGHPPETLDRYQPWVVHGELVNRWLPDEQPVDAWIMEHARERNKKLDYLETMIDQIEALDEAITVEVLARTIDNLDRQEQTMTAAVESYRTGDIAGLTQSLFSAEDVARYPAMYEALFESRNKAWLPEIKQHLQRGDTLIVVGAGHLIGPENLIEMLRATGWNVVRSAYKARTSSFETTP